MSLFQSHPLFQFHPLLVIGYLSKSPRLGMKSKNWGSDFKIRGEMILFQSHPLFQFHPLLVIGYLSSPQDWG